jgi:hypothetical protein
MTPATNNPWPMAANGEAIHPSPNRSNAAAPTIVIILLIGPIGDFSDVGKMWVTILNTRIKHGDVNSSTWITNRTGMNATSNGKSCK